MSNACAIMPPRALSLSFYALCFAFAIDFCIAFIVKSVYNIFYEVYYENRKSQRL